MHEAAAGVEVSATHFRRTTFGPLIGRDAVAASAESAATVQTFVGDTGVPFIVCGNKDLGGYDLLTNGQIDPVKAQGLGRFPIQEAQVPRCGAGAAFKGKIKEGAVISDVPSWVDSAQGNGFNSNIQAQVLGSRACLEEDIAILEEGSGDVDCDLLLPVADRGTGNGNSIRMQAVDWGIFHVTGDGSGNPKYWGGYRASGAYLVGGRTSTEIPAHGGVPRVIRLIE